MLLNGRIAETGGLGPAPLPIGFSFLLHACLLALLIGARPIQLPRLQPAYQQLIQGREHKLVWYHFKDKLPEIKPARSKADNRALRAEVKIRSQSIVSAPKKAPKAPQTIWQKAPEIHTDIQFDSANLVAMSLPKIDPPKKFVPPTPQQRKLYSPQMEAPAPPQVDPVAARIPVVTTPVELAAVSRPLRDFRPPVPARRATALPKIDEAAPPDLEAGPPKQADLASIRELPAASRPLRDFKPPPPRPKAGLPQVSTVESSASLAAGTADTKSPAVGQVAETSLGKIYRPFEAPAQKTAGKPGVAVPVLPAPPPADVVANSPDLNVVVVGLNPGSELPALPPVSRPATFSAGPKLNPKGGTGERNNSAALTVPDLTIRSGNIDTRSTIMARNTIPQPTTTADTLRDAAKYITVDEIGRPSATRVSNAPDPRFDGRTVYMMAIQMPNITSYMGSWLLWFSERNARPSTAVVTPPVVHRKVDPKYVAEAVSERVEGIVRLAAVVRKDGTVGSVDLVRGLDDRLDRTAREALAKWQFAPALRNGEPIDVDILVEIPFRLAPRALR
jgi:TonB family protein